MKTIRYHIAAGGMLAALACLMLAGPASAEQPGRARLSDLPEQTSAPASESELIIRGSSDIRRRNARTTAALRRLFSGSDQAVQTAAPIRQVGYDQVIPAGGCCPADNCCAPSCVAPDQCCAPTCSAPNCCAPIGCAPESCAPECCAPINCAAPIDCGCPAGGCDCAPSCSCPGGCDACAPSCACPADGCCPDACDGCDAAGRIHIGDGFAFGARAQGSNARDTRRMARRAHRSNRNAYAGGQGPCGHSGSLLNRHCVSDFLCGQAAAHRARNRLASYNLNQYLHCKLGFLIHDGNGGTGSPLFGHYSVVYPVDPGHFDGRDGGVYAAEGYGGAVSVPLAPTVRHTYNYGWGIPSSRLTPVSNTQAP